MPDDVVDTGAEAATVAGTGAGESVTAKPRWGVETVAEAAAVTEDAAVECPGEPAAAAAKSAARPGV